MTGAKGNGSTAALGVGVAKPLDVIRKVLGPTDSSSSDPTSPGLSIAGISSPEAVTVAGREDLIDKLVALAAEPTDKFFAAKLRVTSAFHTPLMQPHQDVFMSLAQPVLQQGPLGETVCVMSPVDGKLLDRSMDAQYCWKNIRKPVLFGTSIDKVIKTYGGADQVVFLEIAPHPVLKAYIEQCGGVAVSIVRRPNPKFPALNTGEHHQFLEAIGNLLLNGFSRFDVNKLTTPPSYSDFMHTQLPLYPYDNTSCWSESAYAKSIKFGEKDRPLAAPHFRLSVETHPWTVGHTVMKTVLFPGSGYIESMLQNKAMVVSNVTVSKPLVVNGTGSSPNHVGVKIDGDKWSFQSSSNGTFINGSIQFDTTHASGNWSTVNEAIDRKSPKTFDVSSLIDRAECVLDSKDFYDTIPVGYNYTGHFHDHLREIYQVPDEQSWGHYGYLSKFEIPKGHPELFGAGFCIHPGLLDAFTQTGLAMFVDYTTKLFGSAGLFVPVKIGKFSRWDLKGGDNLDDELQGEVYVYFTIKEWHPEGPCMTDYVVVNGEGKVIITIDDFEIAKLPETDLVDICDESVLERLTTVWQPKELEFPIPKVQGDCIDAEFFNQVLRDVRASGRVVVRVLEYVTNVDVGSMIDEVLCNQLVMGQLSVEFIRGAATIEDADAKCGALDYLYTRAATLGDLEVGVQLYGQALSGVDILITDSTIEGQLQSLIRTLSPGALVIILNESIHDDDALGLSTVQRMSAGTIARKTSPSSSFKRSLPESKVEIYHLTHGNEGGLIDLVKTLAGNTDLYIVGDDSAAGIGAMGVASCIVAEMPEYRVFSILFENHTLSSDERNAAIHALRQQPYLWEQHMKISKDGKVYVRRLALTPQDRKDHAEAAVCDLSTYPYTKVEQQAVGAYMPENVGEMQVEVKAIAVSPMTDSSLITVIGQVAAVGLKVTDFHTGDLVIGVVEHTTASAVVADSKLFTDLSGSVDVFQLCAIPINMLATWIALVDQRSLQSEDIVLIHDAAFGYGFAAVQLCQRAGAKFFCTVSTTKESTWLSSALGVSADSIALRQGTEYVELTTKWLKSGQATGFDIVINPPSTEAVAKDSKLIKKLGCFVFVGKQTTDTISSQVPFNTCVVKEKDLVLEYPVKVNSALQSLIASHQANPYKIYRRVVAMDELETAEPASLFETLVYDCHNVQPAAIEPRAQLFNPRKSYILVGGCSELGVRIVKWMSEKGARNIFLTSRRGQKALNKVDMMYVEYMRIRGAHVKIVAADAVSVEQTHALMNEAAGVAPIGGIFVMTVVLRDGLFTNLTQESFDTVYNSKVQVLDVLLKTVDPATLDFMLLFSTIGSVFGNAGQAAYCSSQLYLDKIAEVLPNTISMSFPPITDSGVFKRLVSASRGRGNSAQLSRMGMTTEQVCRFIGDSLVRNVAHYVPILTMNDSPATFPACEPSLYEHLLPLDYFKSLRQASDKKSSAESPASLISDLVGLEATAISESLTLASYGLDSLGASKLSNQLKAKFGIQVSQIQLLGSTTLNDLNRMIENMNQKAGAASNGDGDALSPEAIMSIPSILNDKLAYGEIYSTEASAHQYRIWLAQAQADNNRRRTASKIPSSLLSFAATSWDTHEGYLLTLKSNNSNPFDIAKIKNALSQVVQRHGALRTSFRFDEASEKLIQEVHPYADIDAEYLDLSQHENPEKAAYEMALKANTSPVWKLDQLPLIKFTLCDLGNGMWSFCMIIHHIIMDDASVQIIFSDLFRFYLGSSDVTPLNVHYSDFSDWCRLHPVSAEMTALQLDFWGTHLANVPPLYLPHKRTESPQSEITQIGIDMDMDVVNKFNNLIAAAGTTKFAGWFSAYNLLLHKLSGQTLFAVGTAITQRDQTQLAQTVGFFANILPVKTEIPTSENFTNYLLSFKEDLYACMANKDVQYEDIVQRVKKSAEGRTLFRHLFAQGSLGEDIKSILKSHQADCQSILPLPNGDEKYETLLTVDHTVGALVLRFDHHIFSEKDAMRFLKAYETLIKGVVDQPEMLIEEITLLDDVERNLMVAEASSEGPVAPSEKVMQQLLEETVKACPNNVAIEFHHEEYKSMETEDEPEKVPRLVETVTYAELNALANKIARALVIQGVKPDTPIAICFDRSINMIVAILAIIKSGGCFISMDPEDPILRKEVMMEESNAKFLLTDSKHLKSLGSKIVEMALVVEMDDPTFKHRLEKFSDTDIALRNLSPSHLAYLIFTSGSTGKPKGVMIPHRAISNLVEHSSGPVYGFSNTTRLLLSLSYIFDPFVLDVFGVLYQGGTLVMARKEIVLGDVSRCVNDWNITNLHLTPSLLSSVPPPGTKLSNKSVLSYPTLKTVVVAGEPLGKKLIEQWGSIVRLQNLYGPTEVTVDCLNWHAETTNSVGIIGRPLKNCRIYIVDNLLRPVPAGVEGEICVGGIQVARGYVNRPELSEDKFVQNPWVSGEKIYRTGDLGMWKQMDVNGVQKYVVEYRGREDSQIKLRGQRIELAEVEEALLSFEGIQGAVAVVRDTQQHKEGEEGSEVSWGVVAFVEFNVNLQDDPNLSEYEAQEAERSRMEALKLHVADRLPRFMYPTFWAALPKLPRSGSGKIDRKLLQGLDLQAFIDIEAELMAGQDEGSAPSDVEQQLLDIFVKLLKLEKSNHTLHVLDDLFSAGMTSLMAVQASEMISKSFQCYVSLNNIYLRPTVRELASLILDAIGQDMRQIQAAEEADEDLLIDFLPIKQNRGTLPRIFLIHDVTGMATPFVRLGAYMPNEMYAIGDKYFGLRASEGAFDSIESMAAHYITLMRSVQPHGPYIICGYSFGGTVALSMASQLKASGEEVSQLILLDAIYLSSAERKGLKAGDWTRRTVERISEHFGDITPAWRKRLRREIRKNLEFMFEFDCPFYDSPVTLIVPQDRSWYRSGHASDFDTGADDANGWKRWLGGELEVKVSGGRHDTMLAPAYVKSLAAVMKDIVGKLPVPVEEPKAIIAPKREKGMVEEQKVDKVEKVVDVLASVIPAGPVIILNNQEFEAEAVPVLDADDLARIKIKPAAGDASKSEETKGGMFKALKGVKNLLKRKKN
ncbi:hypothetical protein HDV05_002436 [Chytridiales sp. JEL 0842]|nr:hypothetical protein HDV05_002436 [Chytridiales sp. JEL 0842]